MSETLREGFKSQIESPSGKDVRVAKFGEAMLNLIDSPHPPKVLEDIAQTTVAYTPAHAANRALKLVTNQLVTADSTYPLEFTTADRWIEGVYMIDNHPDLRAGLRYDAENRQVTSNVVKRYKIFKLGMFLLQQHFGVAPKILDVACSRNHGLKRLRLNYDFDPIECGLEESTDFPSRLVNTLFNNAINYPTYMGEAIGTDIVPLDNESDKTWARNCSFNPSELLDEKVVSEYDFLDNNDIPGVGFELGNFIEEGLYDDSELGKVHAVITSTFMHQLTRAQQIHCRRLFRKQLTKKGAILYLNFARKSPDGRDMNFEDTWDPYTFRIMAEFADDPDGNLYELLQLENGRCKKWLPGEDIEIVLQKL